jgi:type II secretory pathway predicted ATPase ExeA
MIDPDWEMLLTELEKGAGTSERYVLVGSHELRSLLRELRRFHRWQDHIVSLQGQMKILLEDFPVT